MNPKRLLMALGATVLTAGLAAAEDAAMTRAVLPSAMPVASANNVDEHQTCSPNDLLVAPSLTLRQRGCFYRARILSKTFPVRSALFNSMAEIRGGYGVKNPGLEDFAHRFATSYARRTAQNSAEFLVGYLHKEDPRYRPSMEQGILRRMRSALLSVVMTTDDAGGHSLAMAPIAGALGSGMTSVACYRYHNSWQDGLQRSGSAYSVYFTNALVREFRPEISGLASRFLHKR